MRAAITLLCLGLAMSAPAQAALKISSAPTKNVTCSTDAGLCQATAKNAVLSTADLDTMLGFGNTVVKTGGGAVTIEIAAPFAWAVNSNLTLQADLDVNVRAQLTDQGPGGLTISTGQGGDLSFFPGGKIDFWDTTSGLTINSKGYVLAKDIASLALAAFHGMPNVALVNDYDAGADGTYQGAAIPAILSGSFEGLGHTLSNLSVSGDPSNDAGMFELIGNDARDFTLTNVNIAVGDARYAGALAGEVDGTISHVSVSGQVGAGSGGSTGGLVGYSAGSIVNSFSSAAVVSGSHGEAGGLAGRALSISSSQASGNVTIGNHGAAGGLAGKIFSPTGIPLVAQSFATGNVRSGGTNNADAIGGLVGQAGRDIDISDCYATGSVQAGGASRLGGLVGESDAKSITGSYAIGAVTLNAAARHKQARVGGFIGDHGLGALSQDYWDVDTGGQGSACGQNCPGVTGLTDAELKSGLPAGFDAAIWGQSAAINSGYPYLLANPPQ
jgi:hypothetical protein